MSQSNAAQQVKTRAFVVGSIDANGYFSLSSRPYFHASLVDANAEAARLARKEPGKLFVSMQLTGGSLVGGVQTL
jgi:hypothetical protein